MLPSGTVLRLGSVPSVRQRCTEDSEICSSPIQCGHLESQM